ncbi:MAG: hypothetical protein ACRCSR_03020, partial [Bacteroidales bacterium]
MILTSSFRKLSVRSEKLLLAGIMLLALFVTSCRTTREEATILEQREKTELIERLEVTQSTIAIPKSEVRMEIPMENLRNLPYNASYADKNGQAGVNVKIRGDTLLVTATCDSLQREVERLSKEMIRIRSDTLSFEKDSIKTRSSTVQTLFNWYLSGLLSGFIILFVMYFIKRKRWEKYM